MIHSRPDYARIQDLWKKIPDDEPVLLLRAQDGLAASALLKYLEECEKVQPADVVAPLRDHIEKMLAWPTKKMPDVPTEPLCSCGAKAASECGPDDQWEPGCDLGNNPKHAVAFEPTVQQMQAAYALLQSKFEALQAAERALSESYVRIRRIVGAMSPPRLDSASLCEYVEGVVQERVRAESTAEPGADKFKLVPLVPTEEDVAKAMEAAYLEDQEWPNGDVAVVRAFTLHYKESA